MPEVQYSTDVVAPINTVWRFVERMDNWAPFLTGYQRHEQIDNDNSIWFVKGELGGIARVAEFKVHVTGWFEPNRVTFTLEGIEEPVNGSGEFLAESLGPGAPAAPQPAVRPGLLARLTLAISRWMLRRATDSRDVERASPATNSALSRISFKLELNAGGMAGPVMNILLAPLLHPVAEDLALKIAKAVEREAA